MSHRNPCQLTPGHLQSKYSIPPHLRTKTSNPSAPSRQLNPNAGDFAPSTMPPPNGIEDQDRVTPSLSLLDTRVNCLNREQASLRKEFEDLKTRYNDLHASMELMKKGGWSVNIGPFKEQLQGAAKFKQSLDQLGREVRGDDMTDGKKAHSPDGPADTRNNDSITTFVPPHLRSVNGGSNGAKSRPPHLRAVNKAEGDGAVVPPNLCAEIANGSPVNSVKSDVTITADANNPLVTDGNVDTSYGAQNNPAPSSPDTAVKRDTYTSSARSSNLDKGWEPHFLTTLDSLPESILSDIPTGSDMESFSPDFIRNTFSGLTWSPGLNYIPPGPGPCILKNRTYYTLDAESEPYLPQQPGAHGAKLTAFFNLNPEEIYGDLEEGSSFENVPMFVMLPDPRLANKKRYFYFGHYSQTRWSDKLDYDRMVQCVPQHVKEYWAEELSAVGRPEWVTEALMKHFFPKPEYDGRMLGREPEGSITSEEESKLEEKVKKDVKKYFETLRSWESEARMKTSMIKREFILQAFERADADDPPALRLWWEYLQCVDWKKDLYDMLVTLQSRQGHYLK